MQEMTDPETPPQHEEVPPRERIERADRLYAFMRRLIGFAMRVAFRSIAVRGAENIPRLGPVMLAANHPSSLIDSFSVARTTGRKVNFLATSTMFNKPWLARILGRLGVIPVYRRMDAAKEMVHNVDTFRTCAEVFERGGVIGIFPEGITHVAPQVKEMKTGAARIALETEAHHGFGLGLKLVPVGINLSRRDRYRRELTLRVGEPIHVADYREAYTNDPRKAVRDLIGLLQSRIEALVVHLVDLSKQPIVEAACALFVPDWAADPWVLSQIEDKATREVEIRRRVAAAVEYYAWYQPAWAMDMHLRIEGYRQALERLDVNDEVLRRNQGALPLLRDTLPTAIVGVLGAPLAVFGWLINSMPRRLTEWIARRIAKVPAQVDVHRLWIGLAAFAFVYGLALWGIHAVAHFGWRDLVVAVVLFPLVGWLSSRYFEAIRSYRQSVRLTYLQLVRRRFLEELRLRRALLAEDKEKLRQFLFLETLPTIPNEPDSADPARSGQPAGPEPDHPSTD